MKRIAVSLFAFGAMSLSFADSAHAATFDAICTASTTFTVSKAAPNTTGSVTCPQFNAALGTLTSAEYLPTMSGAFLTGSSVTISNPTSSGFSVSSFVPVSLIFTVGPFTNGQTFTAPSEVYPPNVPAVFPAYSSTILLSSPYATISFLSQNLVTVSDGSLPALIGTGDFNVPMSLASIDSMGANQGAVGPLQLSDYAVSIYWVQSASGPLQPGTVYFDSMIYTYTPVPEPSSVLGILACLASASAILIRKR